MADGLMSPEQDPIRRRAIRWALIVGAVIVIVGVNVNNLREHLFSTGTVTSGRASGEKSATIAEKWRFTQSGPISAALALGDDGTVYAASEDGFLYAIDVSGNLQWKFNAGPLKAAPVLGADGTIYLSNDDQSIFAVNHTGTQQWVTGGGP